MNFDCKAILRTLFFSKWKIFFKIVYDKKKLIYLFFSGFLIFINWAVWIYAVATERIIDASFGYFIMPIISVLLGYIFFKEKLNKKRIFSIILVFISILILILFNLKTSHDVHFSTFTSLSRPNNRLLVEKTHERSNHYRKSKICG